MVVSIKTLKIKQQKLYISFIKLIGQFEMFFCKRSKMAKRKTQKDNESNYYHFLSRNWLYYPFSS